MIGYRDEAVTVHVGDCQVVLPTLAAESAHCVVTSPPYWYAGASPPSSGSLREGRDRMTDLSAIGDALRRERDEYIARIAGLEQANAVLEGHAAEVENENKRLADQNDGLLALLREAQYIIDATNNFTECGILGRIDAALAEPSGE